MIRIAWRSLTAHKLRTFLTTLAILLGVAMISGTYVLSDQIDRGFKNIFTDAYKGIDVTVTRKAKFTEPDVRRDRGPAAVAGADRCRGVDGVAEAYGYVTGTGAIAVRRQGGLHRRRADAVLLGGARPTSATRPTSRAACPRSPARSPSSRSWRRTRSWTSARRSPWSRRAAARRSRVSGVFTFASQSSLGGSTAHRRARWPTRSAGSACRAASREIDVKAVAGVSADTLAQRVQGGRCRPTPRSRPGAQAAADQTKAAERRHRHVPQAHAAVVRRHRRAGRRLHHLQRLLHDGGAAAPRVRHAARARRHAAPGADRASPCEALVMGLLASVARPPRRPRHRRRRDPAVPGRQHRHPAQRPRAGAAHRRSSSLAVGVIVTLLSAVVPAARATRVPPIGGAAGGRRAAAVPVRALHAGRRRRRRRARRAAASSAACTAPARTTSRLGTIAFGAVLVFVAVAIASKYLIRPLAGALGWPLQKLAPVSGRLARDNTVRNPGAHGRHGVGADDRPRRGRVRGRASPRASRARSSTASTRSRAPTTSSRARTS